MFFSVIVPIYKVEKYLVRCIESVLKQSFEDFELILVDDGSPDRCPEICDEYMACDNRIRVIHKENGGLVSARQAGIKTAAGEYVFNLDSDDAITPDALSSAYEIIMNTSADIVSFSYRYGSKTKDDVVKEGLYDKEGIEKNIFPKMLSDENMRHLFYFLSGKAVKRSIITEPQLSVDAEISMGEDICCAVPCYLRAERIYMSRKAVYLYTVRNDSLTTSFAPKHIVQAGTVVKYLKSIDAVKCKDFDEQISRYFCYMCFAILAAAAEGKHFDKLKETKKLILNSEYRTELKKARFSHITLKSRISIFLIKKNCIGTAFLFLYLCKCIKRILGKKG